MSFPGGAYDSKENDGNPTIVHLHLRHHLYLFPREIFARRRNMFCDATSDDQIPDSASRGCPLRRGFLRSKKFSKIFAICRSCDSYLARIMVQYQH